MRCVHRHSLLALSLLPVAFSSPTPLKAIRPGPTAIMASPGVPRGRVDGVARDLAGLRPHIDRDFGEDPGKLTVQLVATHSGFASLARSERRTAPQSSLDDNGGIVANTLLLGPLPGRYLRHDIAHVYTEWVLDHVTGNVSDRLPAGTWLYDGLAEYEAYRWAARGWTCRIHDAPLDITTVQTPHAWLALRRGPFGDIAYCLAADRVRRIVNALGWRPIVALLHREHHWNTLATQLARVPVAPLRKPHDHH